MLYSFVTTLPNYKEHSAIPHYSNNTNLWPKIKEHYNGVYYKICQAHRYLVVPKGTGQLTCVQEKDIWQDNTDSCALICFTITDLYICACCACNTFNFGQRYSKMCWPLSEGHVRLLKTSFFPYFPLLQRKPNNSANGLLLVSH